MARKRTKRTTTTEASPAFPTPTSAVPPPTLSSHETALGVRAALEVAETGRSLVIEARTHRPPETLRKYKRCQQDWRDWCAKKSFDPATRETVTGDKLAAFLLEEVVHRAPRKRGPPPKEGSRRSLAALKRAETAQPGTGVEQEPADDEDADPADGPTVSATTIESYLAAIVDLWNQQVALSINSNPHPRYTPSVVAVKKLAKHDEHERKRKANIDRGAGTLQDGYLTVAQFSKILSAAMNRNNAESLRNRLGMCLGHYGLMRSSNILGLQLADLSSIELKGEGPTECFAVVALLQHGKTNKDGRTEYGAFIRSQQVEACGVGALGFHLFYQFHCANHVFPGSDNSFPSFDRSDDWFNLALLGTAKAPNLSKPLAYPAFMTAVRNALKTAGLKTTAATHVFRGSAARIAHLLGASRGDVTAAGRWVESVVDRYYLTGLPLETMRTLAGFRPTKGSFFLERDIAVPEELLAEVFPEADEWIERLTAGNGTIAALGFLKLLVRLRKVIIQDAACLRRVYPQHVVFAHPLFSKPAFLAFEAAMTSHLLTVSDPRELQLQRVLPELSASMDAQFKSQAQKTAELGAQVAGAVDAIAGLVQRTLLLIALLTLYTSFR